MYRGATIVMTPSEILDLATRLLDQPLPPPNPGAQSAILRVDHLDDRHPPLKPFPPAEKALTLCHDSSIPKCSLFFA